MTIDQFIVENLIYDSEKGILSWRPGTYAYRRNKGHAGTMNNKGYRTIKLKKQKEFMAHRIMWFLYYGEWPSHQIDHKDMDRLNNKISNLRLASNAENSWNQGIKSNNLSGYKSVFLLDNGRYRVSITVKGERINLGCFATAEEAGIVYEKKAAECYREFFRPTLVQYEVEAA